MAKRYDRGDEVGDWILEERLGGGGFGEVWRARHRATGQVVAVKILSTQDSGDLRADIEVLAGSASSKSSHVVRILGGGGEPVPHIVMEYVDGPDLAELLTERGKMPVAEVLQIGEALADALQALNAVGIIHRDVKPGNVMLDGAGTYKLTDFGIAKIVGYGTITTSRAAPMTMAYAAPEVWDGQATHQSDLYALGCVLFQCLTGRPPFVGNPGQLYALHRNEAPDLAPLSLDTPASLRDLISRCLAKEPASRPADAAECMRLLKRAAVEHQEATSTVVTASEPTAFGPWLRRSPHPDLPWAWSCVHQATEQPAVVEVHSFDTLEGADAVRRAYEINGQLVEHGAERILGFNRMLLRPGESWVAEPPGQFQFWVAREPAHVVVPGSIGVPALGRVVEDLTAIEIISQRAGVAVALAPNTLALGQSASLRILRPGLTAAVGGGPLEFLRALPLDGDGRDLVNSARSLDDVRVALAAVTGVPAAAGGAFGVAVAQDARGASTGSASSMESVVGVRRQQPRAAHPPAGGPPSGHSSGPPPPAPPLAVAYPQDERPNRRSLWLAVAAAAVLAVAGVGSAVALLSGGGSSDSAGGGTDPTGAVTAAATPTHTPTATATVTLVPRTPTHTATVTLTVTPAAPDTGDADGDGIAGAADRCPTQAEDRNGYQDSDGCPEGGNPDPDGDGITSAADACPTQAEDRNNYQDSDGCPDGGNPDPDNDGIRAPQDLCPTSPEDVNGYQDSDGCPEGGNPDPDGDGFRGGADSCPNSAETVNGYQDSDGCPDTIPPTPTPTPTPPVTAARLDVTLDKQSYKPGDPVAFCYSISPELPFIFRFYKSQDGGPKELLLAWTDDGRGDCVFATMGTAGVREYTFEAWTTDGSRLLSRRILHTTVGPGFTTFDWVE